MNKKDFLKAMSPLHRRELIRRFSLGLSSAAIPSTFSYGLMDLLGAQDAFAQDREGTFFLEVNFRDQWDFASAFVSPSIAQNFDKLKKDGADGIWISEPPTKVGNHFLTKEGMALKDHVDSIAVLETCELVSGSIHGHEDLNCLRSPGRSRDKSGGKMETQTVDQPNSNSEWYSSSPTPAILHNYHSRILKPELINGVVLRSTIRGAGRVLHFAGTLPNAQMFRANTKNDFLKFVSPEGGTNAPKDVLNAYREQLVGLIKTLDTKFLKERELQGKASDDHLKALALASQPIGIIPRTTLALTPDELNRWTADIPGQYSCGGDQVDQCKPVAGSMNLGEMYALVSRVFKTGQIRTMAIELDFHDVHDVRNEFVLTTQGRQTGLALARLIQQLKDDGIYDRTVIAIYTLDGSRDPRRQSNGQFSKNAIILAGGGIKGGYYGDVKIGGRAHDRDQSPSYHRPDDKGVPIADGDAERSLQKRVPSADVYRTVMKAAKVPDAEVEKFPDAKNGKIMQFMLKT